MIIEIFLKKNGCSDVEVDRALVGRDVVRPESLVKELLNGHLCQRI